MSTCVEITKLDDGTFTVRECEPTEQEEPGEGAAQPAQSLDEAFSAAEGILTGGEDSAAAEDSAFNQAVGGGNKGVDMATMLASNQGGKR